MSRPNKGIEHVEHVEGAAEAKARLVAVLETIAGTRSVEDACAQLCVSPARFDQLRAAALAGAVSALEPRPAGRPCGERPDEETLSLRTRVAELERENERLRVREEIALQAPGLLEPERAKKGRQTERRPPP